MPEQAPARIERPTESLALRLASWIVPASLVALVTVLIANLPTTDAKGPIYGVGGAIAIAIWAFRFFRRHTVDVEDDPDDQLEDKWRFRGPKRDRIEPGPAARKDT